LKGERGKEQRGLRSNDLDDITSDHLKIRSVEREIPRIPRPDLHSAVAVEFEECSLRRQPSAKSENLN